MIQRPALAVTYASDPSRCIQITERNHQNAGSLFRISKICLFEIRYLYIEISNDVMWIYVDELLVLVNHNVHYWFQQLFWLINEQAISEKLSLLSF